MWIYSEKKEKSYGRNPHVLRIFLKFSLDEGRQFLYNRYDASICLSLYVHEKVLEFRVRGGAGFMKMTFQPKNTQSENGNSRRQKSFSCQKSKRQSQIICLMNQESIRKFRKTFGCSFLLCGIFMALSTQFCRGIE